MSNLLDWAKWWIAAGCAVFPLPPNRKRPTEGGLGIRSATTKLANVEAWWTANPDCNIGVVGDPKATDRFLLRVDVDPKRDGHIRWRELIQQYGDTPTLTVKTPSGGFHYYFTTRAPMDNSPGNLPAGIDIRGHESGYTVGAGSVTIEVPKESVAGAYTLENTMAMADAPQWLIDIIRLPKGSSAPAEPITVRTEITAEQYAELRSALMSPGMLRDWRRWSDNGLALRTLGDAGHALWCEYSAAQLAACPNETPGDDTAETWWHRHRPESVKSDYRSIFLRAQALGWKNPKAVDTTTLGFGAQQMVIPGAPAGSRFKLLSEAEFTSGQDPEWRIDGILPEEGLAMIYGPSGVGKSFLNLDMIGCIADGRRYGIDARKVKQGRVVYVLAEGAAGMRKRLRAYRHKYPASHGNLKLIDAVPNLMTPQDVGEIMQTIMEAGGADVVVFDTLHMCMAGGDENSSKDTGIVLTHARAIAACIKGLVILIHHTGKDEARGARGSSALKGAMEAQIEVSLNPRNPSRRIVSLAKQRDEDDSSSWEFDLEQVVVFGDKPFSSVVIRHLVSSASPQAVNNGRSANDKDRRHGVNQTFLCDLVKQNESDYPHGIPMEVLIMLGCRQRADLKNGQVQKLITKSIEEGLLSIDSDTNLKLLWR